MDKARFSRKTASADQGTGNQLTLFRSQSSNYRYLRSIEDQIERCLKCGLCRSVCPIFAEVLDESACARGKIALAEALLDGEIGLSRIFSDRLSKCLNCKSCVEICPSGIRVDEIVLATRSEIFEGGRFPLIKRLVFKYLLTRGRLLPPISRTLAFVQRKIMKCLPQSSPYRILLPIVGIDKQRVLPVFSQSALTDQYGEILRPKGKPRMRVGFFLGCSLNLIYTQVAQSVIRILLGEQMEVFIPKDQGCCGMPVYSAGDRTTARRLANKNVKAFGKYDLDAIVVACASCGSALKVDYGKILGLKKNAFGAKIYDFSEFLSRFGKKMAYRSADQKIKVTYHDPCHLSRGQGITEQPRSLLLNAPNVDFVEMNEPKRCCGGGGLFSFTHYSIAKEIGQRKVTQIAATGADALVTSCPSCMMQIEDMLRRSGFPQRVMHVAEIIGENYPPIGELIEKG
ncbi:MAG: (Fe-S)-binding protein [bacterium]